MWKSLFSLYKAARRETRAKRLTRKDRRQRLPLLKCKECLVRGVSFESDAYQDSLGSCVSGFALCAVSAKKEGVITISAFPNRSLGPAGERGVLHGMSRASGDHHRPSVMIASIIKRNVLNIKPEEGKATWLTRENSEQRQFLTQ
jgi:hypothetical protein